MVGKQGIFRTIEALIAIFITFAFLAIFLPQQREQVQQLAPPNALAGLAENDDFRNCVVQKNDTCINESIDKALPRTYNFRFNLSEDPNAVVSGLPDERVYANSLFIAGNITNATKTVVRLYFWEKGS